MYITIQYNIYHISMLWACTTTNTLCWRPHTAAEAKGRAAALEAEQEAG